MVSVVDLYRDRENHDASKMRAVILHECDAQLMHVQKTKNRVK